MNETTTTEELLDALLAAGVDLDAIDVPDEEHDVAGALYTRVRPFEARRPDLGQVLSFDLDHGIEGQPGSGWLWGVWEDQGRYVADGWEPDLVAMVARVVSFLSTEAE